MEDNIVQDVPEEGQRKEEDTEHVFELRPLLPDRRRGHNGRGWARTFPAKFSFDDLLPLGGGRSCHARLDVVNGYPATMVVRDEALTDTVGVYVDVEMSGEGKGMRRSVAFRLRVRLGQKEKPWEDHFWDDVGYYGWSDFIGASWEEVVRKGSAYFSNGGDSCCLLGEVGEALTSQEEGRAGEPST